MTLDKWKFNKDKNWSLRPALQMLVLAVPLLLAACGTATQDGNAALAEAPPASPVPLSSPVPGAGPAVTLPRASAPDFRLPDLDGETWTLSQFRGQPVLLFYWATW